MSEQTHAQQKHRQCRRQVTREEQPAHAVHKVSGMITTWMTIWKLCRDRIREAISRPLHPRRGTQPRAAVTSRSRRVESMYQSILLALDGSTASRAAVPHARRLAADSGRITAVYVHELVPGRSSQQTMSGKAAEREVRELVESLAHSGVDVRLRVEARNAGNAAEAIADVAREESAEVIVIGTRGHSQVTALLLGSVAQRLLHIAPCPVLAVPAGASGDTPG
jgi:nucleotide-binding universal stress UspA family protein